MLTIRSTRRALLCTLVGGLCLAAPAGAATNNIYTVAGTGISGFSGDGGPATAAQISPNGVAVTADGGYLITDSASHRVRRVSPDGTISTVAGTSQGFSGDGGPATAAQLDVPFGIAVTPGGGYLFTDTANHRVRRVAPDGTITTVAGSDNLPFGDGGPATEAHLIRPIGVAVTADGGYLIAERNNDSIRYVSPGGIINTVAGNGTPGFSGDGGAATAAQLDNPHGVVPTADGGFLIADTDNHRVRRVSPSGIITTVAGSTAGLSGDGGAATAATLTRPTSLLVAADGSYLISDSGNARVRRVSPSGIITTIVGTVAGFAGDGGPATAARLDGPVNLAFTAEGDILIADQSNHRVRLVDAGDPPDTTGPVVTVTTPAQGATYVVGQSVLASYNCVDAGSGMASCVGTVANGAAINTATTGAKTFTVTAKDNAGNTTVKTVNYTVNKAPTRLVATRAARTLLSITFSATLTRVHDSTALPGKTVTFRIGGATMCSASTSAAGRATCTKSGLFLGSGTYTATFAGDGSYLASSATAPF